MVVAQPQYTKTEFVEFVTCLTNSVCNGKIDVPSYFYYPIHICIQHTGSSVKTRMRGMHGNMNYVLFSTKI